MSATRLRAPLVILSGVIMAVVGLAGPASATDAVYPPVPPVTQVLGVTATAKTPAQVTASAPIQVEAASASLAFTGTNAIGVGALGGLLLVGGTAMVVAGRRRKVNS